jgi:predicted methyltransferase
MSKSIRSRRKGFLAAIGVSTGLFLNVQAATSQQSGPPLSSEQIAQIVNSADRTAADRTNDERRKPEQMLGFIGIRPGIVAVDLSAAGGYTTELLARAIGPSGKVYGQSRPRDPNRVPTPRSRPRATATRPPRRVRRQQRRQARHVHPPSPSPNAKTISEAMASRPPRSSRSPDRSKIRFRPSSR